MIDLRVQLVELASDCYADPLEFVRIAFPWGKGPLAAHDGPDVWQIEFLEQWGAEIEQRGFTGSGSVSPILMGRSSGHGIGKSALVAWAILFLSTTRPHVRGTVTASTAPQLATKTWPELAKWHSMCLWRDWFEVHSGRGSMKIVAKGHEETWRMDAQTCAIENSEAFAGQHNEGSSSVYIFDEASGVPDRIHEVAQGGLTDGEPHVLAFGNPTRPNGWFYEAMFGKRRNRWNHGAINAETSRFTNHALHEEWAQDWGRSSDFYRVRVLGLPPAQGDFEFISTDIVEEATRREVVRDSGAQLVIGVDVARFGGDDSVIRFRHGRDARSIPPRVYRGVDTMQLSGRVAEVLAEYPRATCMIDGGGVGGGVVDRVRQLGHRIIDVNAGRSATENRKYANKRAEMWSTMRDWLSSGGCIDDHDDLRSDLIGIGYGFDKDQRLLLEKKEAMKKRGLSSPDHGDALAMTFAVPVARADMQDYSGPVQAVPSDWDVMA